MIGPGAVAGAEIIHRDAGYCQRLVHAQVVIGKDPAQVHVLNVFIHQVFCVIPAVQYCIVHCRPVHHHGDDDDQQGNKVLPVILPVFRIFFEFILRHGLRFLFRIYICWLN